MATKLIQISLPEELVFKIDAAAKEEFASRSEFIRAAIVDKIKVVAEQNLKLAAATKIDAPTEEMILDLLKFKERQRRVVEWQLEWRRERRGLK